MKINAINGKTAFGRALTSKEAKECEKLTKEAKAQLGLDKTLATVFDTTIPTNERDTGIGTSFSYEAVDLANRLKALGFSGIQYGPQGEISNDNRSPYSCTSFSLGHHLIDLKKLETKEYGSLLTEKEANVPYFTRVQDHHNVDYNNVFARDGQEAMLKKAYSRFEMLDETSPLKQDFEQFKKDNSYWLERDALYQTLVTIYGSADITKWSFEDQNLFATKEGNQPRIEQLREVRDDAGNNVVEYEEFVQFIADKQQKESKAKMNLMGLETYGDCQIGFSQKDFWAHRSAFSKNYEFGCDIGGGKYSCWSQALDFNKLDGEAGELLYNKFDTYFKRYDGVRIDAAWQLIKPLICEPVLTNGNFTYDQSGNKLGYKLNFQPQIKDNGKYIMKDIVLKAAENNGVSPDKILLELLGGNSWDSLDAVKDLGMTLIHITRYGKDDWGRVKYYESKGENKYQNMRPGDYIIGSGTHDDDSVLKQAQSAGSRIDYLAKDLHENTHELRRNPLNLAQAIIAELFTTKNQFMTLPDILGSIRRINTPNTKEGNWTYRAPQDFERYHNQNLSQNKGLNMPDMLSRALKAKSHGQASELTEKLDRYAGILKEDGPMTTEEADRYLGDA